MNRYNRRLGSVKGKTLEQLAAWFPGEYKRSGKKVERARKRRADKEALCDLLISLRT